MLCAGFRYTPLSKVRSSLSNVLSFLDNLQCSLTLCQMAILIFATETCICFIFNQYTAVFVRTIICSHQTVASFLPSALGLVASRLATQTAMIFKIFQQLHQRLLIFVLYKSSRSFSRCLSSFQPFDSMIMPSSIGLFVTAIISIAPTF